MAPRWIITRAEGHMVIDLRRITSVGRHAKNTIQLGDKTVSSEHCVIERRDGECFLRDLESLNGTFVNDERVRGERLLRHGDELRIGATRGRYDDGVQPSVNKPLDSEITLAWTRVE